MVPWFVEGSGVLLVWGGFFLFSVHHSYSYKPGRA